MNAKPCGRCVITTLDHNTGEKSRDTLKYLGKYKLWKNQEGEKKIIFAENSLIEGSGDIAVGSRMYVSSLRNPPLNFESKEIYSEPTK